jgi:hypothetical protein
MLLLLRTNTVTAPSELEPLAIGAVTIERDDFAIDPAFSMIEYDGAAIAPGYSIIEREAFAIDPALSVIESI